MLRRVIGKGCGLGVVRLQSLRRIGSLSLRAMCSQAHPSGGHDQHVNEPPVDEEQVMQELQSAIYGKRAGRASKDVLNPADPSDILVFSSTQQGRIALGLMGAIIPGVWGTSLMALRLLDFPQEQSGSWPFIGLLIASSWVFGYLNARIANFSVRELWLTEGGSHVRIRTFRIFGGYGPSSTLPIKALRERAMDKPDRYRYLGTTVPDGPLMCLHRDGTAHQPHLLERILRGQPVDLSQVPPAMEEAEAGENDDKDGGSRSPGTRPPRPGSEAAAAAAAAAGTTAAAVGSASANPDLWREAEDAAGRVYYWNVVTRETRWEAPDGWDYSSDEEWREMDKEEDDADAEHDGSESHKEKRHE